MAKYYISLDNSSGLKFNSFEDFIQELQRMNDDFLRHGGTEFSIYVDANAECFLTEEEVEEFLETQ